MKIAPRQSEIPSSGRRVVLGMLACLPCMALYGCGESRPPSVHTLVGKPLPAFSLTSLSGEPLALGHKAGRPLVINFWATWCAPCRAEMGGLERLYQALAPGGLKLIGITVDEDLNLIREYLLQEKISFPIYRDPKSLSSMALLGKSYGLPTTVLVGRDGVVRDVVRGERRWDEPPMRDSIAALMA